MSRLRGPLRIAGGAFADDSGPVLPVICHAGDLFSRFVRDREAATNLLREIAEAGYDGVRTWTVLHGDYWAGREVGPMHQSDYFAHVDAFCRALSAAGLRWVVSQGDMLRALASQTQRVEFMRLLARTIAGVDPALVLFVDAGNEAWQNGESDPGRMREVVRAFTAVIPAIHSLTSPPGEERDELDQYAGDVYDVHGYRGGEYYDKIRHIFSIPYEGKPAQRLGIQSEPFGPGRNVSVTDNMHQLDSDTMKLAVAQSLLARQAWVYFCSPGVISDGTSHGRVDGGERFAAMPGFAESCAVRDALPRDLMTFASLVHGGVSQKGKRVFAVPTTDETRADHAIASDGRFVCVVYGPRWRDVYAERPHYVEKQIDCGGRGRIIVGRLA